MGQLIAVETRLCSHCGTEKPESDWRPASWARKPGSSPWCRLCVNLYEREWRDSRPPEVRQADRRVRADREQTRHRRLRSEDPKAYADRQRQWRHGLSSEKFDAMVIEQGGLCANSMCSEPLAHVDHDHSCCATAPACGGCVRSLLCRSCNLTLGNSGESTERLLGLVEYLVMQGGQ